MYLIVHDAVLTYFTIRHFRNEKSRLVPECIPQLLLGLLLGINRSAIGQFFSVSSESDKEINCKNRGRGSYWLSTLDL